jgi:hypothetical protein
MLCVIYAKCHKIGLYVELHCTEFVMPCVIILGVIYANGQKIGLYAECHYAESHNTECHLC